MRLPPRPHVPRVLHQLRMQRVEVHARPTADRLGVLRMRRHLLFVLLMKLTLEVALKPRAVLLVLVQHALQPGLEPSSARAQYITL